MRYLRHLLLSLLLFAFYALGISSVFSAFKWLLSLTSITEPPTWHTFFWGAIALWILLIAIGLFAVGKTLYCWHKHPAFKRANIQTGISWEDYKRLHENDKARMKELDEAARYVYDREHRVFK